MGHDIETSMYAFKQIGHCLMHMNDREKALKAFKCQLQVAWHLNHYLGELSSYENIAITYFYLGKIEKSKYYIDRFYQGKTEAMFSAVKKISLGFTRRRYRQIKALPFKADDFQFNKGKKGQQKANKGARELFSRTLKNYSLLSDEILRNLGFVRKKKKLETRFNDPTGQYIDLGSPISNVSLRNLPSPSEVKGQSHLLLMPFYQEIDEEENRKVNHINQVAKMNAAKRKKQKEQRKLERARLGQSVEEDGADKESSSSADSLNFQDDVVHKRRKPGKNGIIQRSFATSRDDLLIHETDEKSATSRFGPMNAIRVKTLEKQRQEARVNEIRMEAYQKTQSRKMKEEMASLGADGLPQKAKAFDMDALIARAQSQNHQGSKHQLYLSHKSNTRQNKYAKEIEDSHFEQIKNSYLEMLAHVAQEKQRVFIPRQTYELTYKDATAHSQVTSMVPKQQYCFAEELLYK